MCICDKVLAFCGRCALRYRRSRRLRRCCCWFRRVGRERGCGPCRVCICRRWSRVRGGCWILICWRCPGRGSGSGKWGFPSIFNFWYELSRKLTYITDNHLQIKQKSISTALMPPKTQYLLLQTLSPFSSKLYYPVMQDTSQGHANQSNGS